MSDRMLELAEEFRIHSFTDGERAGKGPHIEAYSYAVYAEGKICRMHTSSLIAGYSDEKMLVQHLSMLVSQIPARSVSLLTLELRERGLDLCSKPIYKCLTLLAEECEDVR